MLTLKQVTVHKYKSIETDQTFDVDPAVTVLVGMNESGKTSILEALAKSNYFEDDNKFKFNATHDYPRKEKKKMDKEGVVKAAISCTYSLSDDLIEEINCELGTGCFSVNQITVDRKYDGSQSWTRPKVDSTPILKAVAAAAGEKYGDVKTELASIKNAAEYSAFIAKFPDYTNELTEFAPYFENKWKWRGESPLEEYICRVWLQPRLPKFLYYDEYYTLPSRISIEKLQAASLDAEELKTAKALFELADIDVNELINANEFENFKAELEATEATISEELFEYWSTNTNLEIEFDIDKQIVTHGANQQVAEHVLDIRVKNTRSRVSLPLKNRSKGFNWFFSFLVWFKKIQEDADSQYVILLDEPGLNLHAAAQSDLLNFVDHLAESYQVIYTTHSPFMIRSNELHRVRTVLETENGSVVSDSIQEKDPNTLFPLQAALGYDIAQNLFISERNVLVEGTSDLIFLEAMSAILEAAGRQGLRDDVAIVPVGGLEKVSSFISLLRGSKLKIVCLLDSVIDQSSQEKLDRLIAEKIIRRQNILSYDTFVNGATACDIEDLFAKADYLSYFNGAFGEHPDIAEADLDTSCARVVVQIANKLGRPRYNHYRPANYFARQGVSADNLEAISLDQFEAAIKAVNAAFG